MRRRRRHGPWRDRRAQGAHLPARRLRLRRCRGIGSCGGGRVTARARVAVGRRRRGRGTPASRTGGPHGTGSMAEGGDRDQPCRRDRMDGRSDGARVGGSDRRERGRPAAWPRDRLDRQRHGAPGTDGRRPARAGGRCRRAARDALRQRSHRRGPGRRSGRRGRYGASAQRGCPVARQGADRADARTDGVASDTARHRPDADAVGPWPPTVSRPGLPVRAG